MRSFRNVRFSQQKLPSTEDKKKAEQVFFEIASAQPGGTLPQATTLPAILPPALHSGYADPALRGEIKSSLATSIRLDGEGLMESRESYKSTLYQVNSIIVRPFLLGELKYALKGIKENSAHGPDCSIPAAIAKNMSRENTVFLLKLFNKIFNQYSYSDSWSDYYMIFIPKEGSDKFRPISLSNVFLRVFEKIIFYRLN